MTERLADIESRLAGVGQLGAVVNAMRGIAAARAQQARTQLQAVEAFSGMLVDALQRALALAPAADGDGSGRRDPLRLAIVVFCAEQGFAGAFSERVLNTISGEAAGAHLFLIGSRGVAVAQERGIAAEWSGAMPSQSSSIPRMADGVVQAIYERVADGSVNRLDTVYTQFQAGLEMAVVRRTLFPLDTRQFSAPAAGSAPLLNLAPAALLSELTADYMHAQLCAAGLESHAAEHQARMVAMAAAHTEIERKLAALRAEVRMVRQSEITAEIVELAAGQAASRPHTTS